MARRDLIARLATAPGRVGRGRRRRQRFSTWFAARPSAAAEPCSQKVTLFAGCVVEYERPEIGQDVVQLCDHNGIDCTLSGVGCCGYPSLRAGDIDHFRKVAARNVATLAVELRGGGTIVVADPTCGGVVRREYGRYAPGADAELVAANTFDTAEYLADRCGREALVAGPPTGITYHAACHLQSQRIGLPARRLLEGAGSAVRIVGRCCRVADPGEGVDDATVVSDCCLADRAIPHPLAVLTRSDSPLDASDD
jgi:Fe-S oxidoreductase